MHFASVTVAGLKHGLAGGLSKIVCEQFCDRSKLLWRRLNLQSLKWMFGFYGYAFQEYGNVSSP